VIIVNLEKSLVKEIEIAKDVELIWNKFTTEEGLISFFAPKVDFQLSIGGPFEMLFDHTFATRKKNQFKTIMSPSLPRPSCCTAQVAQQYFKTKLQ